MEGLSQKRTSTYGQSQCGDYGAGVGGRWGEVEEGIRGIDGYEKKQSKINY